MPHTAMKCVVPQAKMNAANIRNSQLNEKSLRLRTKYVSAIGIEKYASPIAVSDTTYVQSNPGVHRKQCPCGRKPVVSKRLFTLSSIFPPGRRTPGRELA